jgi:hypothetical protein
MYVAPSIPVPITTFCPYCHDFTALSFKADAEAGRAWAMIAGSAEQGRLQGFVDGLACKGQDIRAFTRDGETRRGYSHVRIISMAILGENLNETDSITA